jgi:hypothetical protein
MSINKAVLDLITKEFELLYLEAMKLQVILKDLPEAISHEQERLMRKQLVAMNDYLNVLQARMDELEYDIAAEEADEDNLEEEGLYELDMDGVPDYTTLECIMFYARDGMPIARAEWAGRKHVAIMPGYPNGIEANEVTCNLHEIPHNSVIYVQPYWVSMDTVRSITTWSPSAEDTLAEDWYIVE